MPPTMQPVQPARTKQSRKTKSFEVVQVGPIRLYFSHFHLIGFESDKTKIVVCSTVMPTMGNTLKAMGRALRELSPV